MTMIYYIIDKILIICIYGFICRINIIHLIYEPYGGGPVPLTGTDVSNGDRPLPGRSKKLRFFSNTKSTLFYIL